MSSSRRMRSLPFDQIKLSDAFWGRWHKVLVETTLPTQFDQLEQTGRLANLERAAGKRDGDFEGLWFNDSDVYKFVEACAYGLGMQRDAKVQAHYDRCVEIIQAAQQPDGYINSFFQVRFPDLKWRNLHLMHEMYCGGHLIEAGVAAYECLGDRRLLDVSTRFADHVSSVFGPDKRLGYCGHEEIELALIRLAGATGEEKYRESARWMVESRGHRPSPFAAELHDAEAVSAWPVQGCHFTTDGTLGGPYDGQYAQDHAPIRQHDSVVGHAVRAMYLYIAAAELCDEDDVELQSALIRAWQSLTARRMYITGGIGPSSSNEGFTTDFDLPNLTAYAETCASCGLVFWGSKMLEMTGDGDYVDVMERALFNGALSGISLSGDRYFYTNPLESRGGNERTPWFGCACCPPNIARLIGSISKYLVSVSDDAFYVHTPASLEATPSFGGVPVTLKIDADYPWSGKYRVTVEPTEPVQFKLKLRIPAWSGEVEIDFPKCDEPANYESGYAVYDRVWKAGDALTVDLGMEPSWVEADPRVKDCLGRVALTNGPLVYACEEQDLGYAPQLFSADTEAPIEQKKSKALGGVSMLSATGLAYVESPADELFTAAGTADLVESQATCIPYFAWCNRGTTNMQVWLRRM